MRRSALLLMAFSLLAAACGGASETTAPSTTVTTTTVAVAETTTTAPAVTTTTEKVFDIAELEQSVVKILAQGTFIDPEIGIQFNSAGLGSGFIISDDGLVVTNNHVVTGAALLQVWVAGEPDPVNARILGVSECSDLAVIQLTGDGYTPLSFREEAATPGLDVFAAGFPASDASTLEGVDYTLTSGIVSSMTADGETNWASVDDVIEHDARIRGGNSGGPLVDEDGHVVAVNYAGIDSSDQNYAINAADAQPIIDQLIAGNDVDSIGVNGQAIFDAEFGINGIWVASVESGSPASNAGVEPGDIITNLEGLFIATDGTMRDYCDILRTKGPDATMSIEVLRYASDEFLEGELNGDTLVQSFSFAQEFDDEVVGSGPDVSTYANYMNVTDDSGLISVSVPSEWVDTNGAHNPDFGPSIYAAPDLTSFLDTWATPGIIVESSADLTSADTQEVLDAFDYSGQCIYEGAEPYEDVLYMGTLELWSDCGGIGTIAVVLAVTPFDGSYMIRMMFQAVDDRDLDAADQALATFVAGI